MGLPWDAINWRTQTHKLIVKQALHEEKIDDIEALLRDETVIAVGTGGLYLGGLKTDESARIISLREQISILK